MNPKPPASTSKGFRLRVLSPDGPLFDGRVLAARVPAEDGSLGILRNHAPLFGRVEAGELRVRALDGGIGRLMVSEGLLEVNRAGVTLLVDAGGSETAIEPDRARRAGGAATPPCCRGCLVCTCAPSCDPALNGDPPCPAPSS